MANRFKVNAGQDDNSMMEKHYFCAPESYKSSYYCDKCGKYLTDKVHVRADNQDSNQDSNQAKTFPTYQPNAYERVGYVGEKKSLK